MGALCVSNRVDNRGRAHDGESDQENKEKSGSHVKLQHAESVLERKAGGPGNGKAVETTTHIRMARPLGGDSILDSGGADRSRRPGLLARSHRHTRGET